MLQGEQEIKPLQLQFAGETNPGQLGICLIKEAGAAGCCGLWFTPPQCFSTSPSQLCHLTAGRLTTSHWPQTLPEVGLGAFNHIYSLEEEEAGVKFSSRLQRVLGNILQLFHRP